MMGHDLLKDLAFSDQVRRLERPGHNITAGTADSGDEFDILGGVCFLGISIILMGIFCRFRTVRRSCCRVNARDDPELPQHGDKLPNKAKSAHTKRQQAILELFETSQVTMKVSKDDILLGAEEDCIEDIESGGFDDGGILKLSRSAISSNPTPPNASSPLPPPEWCDVPNLCAVCLDSYEPGQVVAWSSGCRHAFHQDCISHYLAKKMIGGETPCPSCRQKFCDLPAESLMSSSSIAGNSTTASESTEA